MFWGFILIKMLWISVNIHWKHLTIDRIDNIIKFSLLEGCSFYFSMTCQLSEMCAGPLIITSCPASNRRRPPRWWWTRISSAWPTAGGWSQARPGLARAEAVLAQAPLPASTSAGRTVPARYTTSCFYMDRLRLDFYFPVVIARSIWTPVIESRTTNLPQVAFSKQH